MAQSFCPDPFWNGDILWVPTNPDFTECFKNSALIWAPCAFVAIFATLDVYRRSQSRYSDIPWSFLNISKSIVLFSLICLQFIDLSMMLSVRSEDDIDIYPVQIVSVGIKILTFILVAFLQLMHKIKGHMSSGLLFLFWLILVVFASVQLRWEIQNYDSDDLNRWREFQFVNYITYFTLITIMLVLNCFADKKPRKTTYVKTESNNPSPEKSSSFLSQIFFQWFDKTTWVGWRRPLTEKDIYDINPDDTSRELVPPFDKYFQQSVEKGRRKQMKQQQKSKSGEANIQTSKDTNGSILPAMVKSNGGPFWFAGLLQIAMNCLTFASPLLLNELILYVNPALPPGPLWQGLLMTFALFIVTFVQSILNGQYFLKTFLVGFRIRSSLISAIYRKALRISNSAKKDTTVGEVVNLMAVDAQRFFELVSYLHVLWSGPMVIGIAIWLIYRILGVAVFAGLAVMILMIPLSGFIAAKLRDLQIVQMKAKDERVKSMNEILNGMKVLKLYAWEPSFEKLILGTRENEMVVLKKAALYNAGTYFVWSLAPFLVSLASFITFVMMGGVLSPNVAFVAISLFNILRFPMAMFPMMIAFIMQAWVSVKRINKFLNSEEIDPNNVTKNKSDYALNVDNGSFTWGGESTTLKNINMKVKKGNLTAIVGSVGCGKTSLVSALLGEMEKLNGNINVDGRTAYVPQQAWIQNSTLRDNILFGRPYDKNFYDKVVEACALVPDLAMLPAGDQTEIGEKGINLSGGQKQRVALARAVYSEADIYLLDDPLSAVDSHVGKHIFDNVFGVNGLLKDKSRLLVTHAVVFLPRVDEIYVMVNGEITESGSYKYLLSQKGAFSEFLTQHLQELEDDEELMEIQNSIQDKDMKLILERSISTLSSEKSSVNGSVRRRKSGRRASEKSEKETIPPSNDKSKLIDSEEAATGSVGAGVYVRYFKSIGLVLGIGAILSNAANQAAAVYSGIWLTHWSSDVRASDPDDPTWRNIYMGGYGGLGVAQAVGLLATSVIFAIGCLRAARDLHNKLLHNTLRLPMSFFDTTPLGRILNRFSKDVDVIDTVLPMSMRFWIMMFFNCIAVLIVISYSTPLFMTVIIPLGFVYYFIQKFYVATSRQLKRIESVTRSPIYTHFSETITGQSTIRAYEVGERFTLESESRVDYNQKMSYPSIVANRWLAVRLEIVGSVVVLFACLFAVLARDTINPAMVGLSISYALQISQVLSFLVRMTAEVETNIVAIERVDEYSNREQEAPWKTVEMDPTWPQKGIVIFKNFQVRYREGLELVLKGIDFSVKSQEKIGIVGRTGAGKSSLTLALFRIIEAAEGKIIIDDINIAEIGLHSLRSRLTIIPQDPVLFSGNLRMNVDPFNVYSDDAIWTALEQSHLKLFVKGLSDGLDYKISEGGENLSVGQRQLVCLARALLRKTKVLILDEATAAIDLETDELIQKTIRTQFTDCTILTIAHRLNTIMDSDRVIVLDQGKIAEYDSPKNLLENKDSIFYGMAKNAGLVQNPNEMTIEEAIDEAFNYDDEDTKL
ncbi:CLUMA_CG015844, isoform A [Clunio marinus]|uniref:ABC-type glutathione-S-conjugate transporter n=1 Tax=Clunio marinus TaxID=568069 RepID=A0A1J1ISK9_9DIPT|nr:CLUMA_CG015844, isoform A [Clunio marinus]